MDKGFHNLTRIYAAVSLVSILLSYHGIFRPAIGGTIGLFGMVIALVTIALTLLYSEPKGPTLATWIATLALFIGMFFLTKDASLAHINIK